MKNIQRLRSLVLLAVLMCSLIFGMLPVQAAQAVFQPGTYEVDASLSCYINAMGGVEFGAGLFEGASVTVSESGEVTATLRLTASAVTIYSVTCDTFVDATLSEPGYYDAQGSRQTAQYTKSDRTALNASNEAVHYVDSITFPLVSGKETYYLWIYINSNVMGSQFGDGSGDGASGTAGVSTPYAAVFTMDWSAVPEKTETADAPEELDGLSIYRAEDTIDAAVTGDVVQSEMQENTGSDPIVIYLCLGMGMLFILLGGMFLIFGNRTKEHTIVIRLEMGERKNDDSK